MYWWRIAPLKEEFSAGGPAEPEKLKYLIATFVLYVATGEIAYLAAESDPESTLTVGDWVSSLVFVLSTILGTYYCYRCNAAGDGRQFIERFICLGWPVSIRFFVFFVLGFIGLAIAGALFAEEILDAVMDSDGFGSLCVIVVEVLYYWFLGRHIHDLAAKRA